jgi:amino acid adenylation domain-containing protein
VTEIKTLNELLDTAIAVAGAETEAITDGRSRLTWGEYRDLAGRIATALLHSGVKQGDRVGVHLHKSVHSFASVHGVVRAGAVMVPLDALAPPAATNAVLRDAGASAVVTGASADAISAITAATSVTGVVTPHVDTAPIAGLMTIGADSVAGFEPAAPVAVAPDDLAYLMYTSGSTGKPKGMAHTHRSGITYARLAAETYDIDSSDRLANIAPLHFDQSTFELYAAPLVGASVLVVSDGVLRFPASLAALIADERITVWYSVPYVLDQMVGRGAIEDHDLGSLRWILYGGEPFPPAALARAMRAIPSARVSNVYGPAEVNQCAIYNLDAPPTDDAPIPIGRAWAGSSLRLVDETGGTVAPGEPGELLVSSDTMMRGYWNRPDLDAQAIVEEDGERWYRTGDLIAVRSDGNLVFLGRIDNQVKVRGHRVEIEAVEAVLLDIDGIDAAAVLVERPPSGDDHLVAVVSPASAIANGRDTDLIRHLAATLPRYAVPSRVVGLDDLPRTGTGKVDRRSVGDAIGVGDGRGHPEVDR